MGDKFLLVRNTLNCIYAFGLMIIITENGHGSLDMAVCISHSANTLGKGMKPIIFSLAMSK